MRGRLYSRVPGVVGGRRARARAVANFLGRNPKVACEIPDGGTFREDSGAIIRLIIDGRTEDGTILALEDGTVIAASINKGKIEVTGRIVDNSLHTRVYVTLGPSTADVVTFFSETVGEASEFP